MCPITASGVNIETTNKYLRQSGDRRKKGLRICCCCVFYPVTLHCEGWGYHECVRAGMYDQDEIGSLDGDLGADDGVSDDVDLLVRKHIMYICMHNVPGRRAGERE